MKNILKSVGYILYYFVLQLIVQFGFSMIAVSCGVTTENEVLEWMMNNVLLIIILSNILAITILVLFFKLRKKSIATEIGIKKVGIKEYILPILSAFSYSMFFSIITYNLEFDNSLQITQSVSYFSGIKPFLGSIMMISALFISAPIAEELIHRGIVVTELRKHYSPVVAISISALMFGLMHIIAGGVVLAIGATIMGAICGIIFIKTKSLFPAIVAHMFANLPNLIIPLFSTISGTIKIVIEFVFLMIFIWCMIPLCKGMIEDNKNITMNTKFN